MPIARKEDGRSNESHSSVVTLDLSGLTHLRSLEWLNLSGNSIKRIQNVEKNVNLYHLDLSDNSIAKINNLRNLIKLKTLLLHGNLISSLKNINENFSESSLVTLSLAENEILDLNEITNLKSLSSLEQLSIAGNPCLLALSNFIGFNYRPFILFNCPRLRNLDGHLISQGDRLEAEKLRSDGQLRTFSPGRHLQLVKYLTQATPLGHSTSRTPTPTIDRISSQADRWSVPVLDEKPSTEAKDLALEDVSQSEFPDDQLVSESCYVPIMEALITSPPSHPNGTLKDWHTTDEDKTIQVISNSNHQELYHTRDVIPDESRGRSSGFPVERVQDEETNRIASQPPNDEAVSGNQDDDDQPLMTEEEALNLIHLAATIIQAHVRGFLVRKKLHFYEYRHKKQAAILIQAVWRGYRTRTYNIKVITARNEIRTRRLTSHVSHLAGLLVQCQEKATRDKRTMAKAVKCLWNELEKQNTRYVAWLEDQQSRAALTIQRYWKGYKARKVYSRQQCTSVTSYQSLAAVCQSLQKQIDFLKIQVEELKSEKRNREEKSYVEEQIDPSKEPRQRSIPAIRVIRPSVCILPEFRLDSSTKEQLKNKGTLESLLDDVDVEIEPLDIGDYDKDEEDARSATFEVGTSAFGTKFDEQDDADVESVNTCEATEDVSKNDRIQKGIQEDSIHASIAEYGENYLEDETGTCLERTGEKPEEPDPTPSEEGITEKEGELKPTSNESKRNEGLVSKVQEAEMNVLSQGLKNNGVPMTGEHKDILVNTQNTEIITRIFDDSNANSNASVSKDDCVTVEVTGSHDEQSEKSDSLSKRTTEEDTDLSETTTSPSIQADVSLSSDISDTSMSDSSTSPSKSDTVAGRKKKKLLLRSTSYDTMPRLRTLHSSSSFDSEHLSSSLNFDSRLSKRSAALLRELQNDIASLTVRHLSERENSKTPTRTEQSADSTENNISTQGKTDTREPMRNDSKGEPSHPTSDTIEMGPSVPRDGPAIRDNEIPFSPVCQSDPPQVNPYITTGNDSPQVNPYITTGNVSPKERDEGTAGSVPDNEDEVGHINACEVNVQPSKRQKSFTIPVFEDVEASMSMEDFLKDSIEEYNDL